MNHSFRFTLVAALGLAVLSIAAEVKNDLSAEAREILEKADSFELYSVKPEVAKNESGEGPKLFHDYPVLGKTVIKGANTRKAVRTTLLQAIASHPKYGAKCFLPRHGLRAMHDGKTLDLLICFECSRISAWSGGKETHLLTAGSAQPLLDRILKDANVPLAKPPGK